MTVIVAGLYKSHYLMMRSKVLSTSPQYVAHSRYYESSGTKFPNFIGSSQSYYYYQEAFFWLQLSNLRFGETDVLGLNCDLLLRLDGTQKFIVRISPYFNEASGQNRLKFQIYAFKTADWCTAGYIYCEPEIETIYCRLSYLFDPVGTDTLSVTLEASASMAFDPLSCLSISHSHVWVNTSDNVNDCLIQSQRSLMEPGIGVMMSGIFWNDLQGPLSSIGEISYGVFPFDGLDDYGSHYLYTTSITAEKWYGEQISNPPVGVSTSVALMSTTIHMDRQNNDWLTPILNQADEIDSNLGSKTDTMSCLDEAGLIPKVKCIFNKMITDPQVWARTVISRACEDLDLQDPGDSNIVKAVYFWLSKTFENIHSEVYAMLETNWGKKQ